MRRRLLRFLARPLRIALAAVALLVAGTLPAHAQEAADPPGAPAEPTISIVPADGSKARTLPYSHFDGARDVHQRRITLPDGSLQTVDGITVKALLARLGIPSSSFSMVITTSVDGLELQILSTQILSDPADPVLIYAGDDGVLRLLRPQTEADTRPAELASAIDGVLTLTLTRGARLTATPSSVRVNELVQFTVTLPPGIDPGSVEYEWDFNDNSPLQRNRRATMSRSFKENGEYNVSVQLYVDGKPYEGDILPFADVSVRAAPKLGRANRRARESGKGRRDAESDGTGDAGSGSGSGDGSGSGGTWDDGWDDEWDDYDDTAGAAASAAAPPPPAAPKRDKPARAPTPPEPDGETVTGYLLASVDGAPLTAGGVESEPTATRLPTAHAGPLEIPPLAWVVTGLVALVVLGWALESRTTLPYFKP